MTNRWLKMLSIFLSLVLIFNLLPLQVLASGIDDAPQPSLSVLPDDGSSGSAEIYERLDTLTIVEEDTSRRGEYYKEFVLNNGLRLAAVYTDPVHYTNGGEWKDIDNTLKAVSIKGVAGYTNTAGVWQVYFPQQLSGSNAISLTKDGYTVSFGMAGELTNSGNIAVASIGTASETLATTAANASAAQLRAVDLTEQKEEAQYEQTVLDKHQSKLAYASVYNNTEIVYDLSGNRLKESVVISKYNASLWGYRYNLNTGGLIPVLLEDNTIELRHPKTEEVVMTMPAPFMVDANGEYNYDVDVSLVQKNGSYLLSYYVPRTWLASADRAWPVVLDPEVEAGTGSSNIQDISFTPTVTETYRHSTIKVGYSTSKGIYRTYIRFVELPELDSSDNIAAAYITLKKPATSSTAVSVEVHKVNQPWTDQTISWGNNDAFNETVEDSITIQNPANYTWDITNIVRGWYTDPNNSLLNNTGLMLKTTAAVENGGVSNWHQFCSSNYAQNVAGGEGTEPALSILLNNSNGLEDYWDYTTVSAGRAGTGYVQNYSGALLWVHNDMGFDGNRMPVSISHIYNPLLSDANEYGLGYGWQTNYHQFIVKASDNSYIWSDGDGTLHHLYPTGTGVYQDNDNLRLTLQINDSQYTLTDQYGNESVFQRLRDGTGNYRSDEKARLIKQTNNQATKSSITISYITGNSMQIFKITDGVGRVYALTYAAAGLMDKIQFKATETSSALYTVQFAYNSASQLSSITYADNKVSTFTYNSSNLITKVQDIDGYNVNFSYVTTDVGKLRRVATVIEKDSSQTGSTTTFTYDLYRTKVTTKQTEQAEQYQVYYFDKWGNTVSTHDEDGRATVSQYRPVSETGDLTHLLTTASTPQITVANMLSDSSFENETEWTEINGSNPSISIGEAYIGEKSLSFSGGGNKGVRSPVLTAQPGESYTFSAYVKSTSLSNIFLSIVAGEKTVKSQAGPDTNSWTRMSVTYRNNTDAVVQMYAEITGGPSTVVYVDCVQVENDSTANRYNILQNGDFSSTAYWTGIGASTTSGTVLADAESAPSEQTNTNALLINGTDNGEYRVVQTAPINNFSKKFVISGWAKVNYPPTYEDIGRTVSIQAKINYSNNTSDDPVIISLGSSDGTEWQYIAAEIEPDNTGTKHGVSITIELVCKNIPGTVYFDGIGLYMEPLGEHYSYDDYGNVSIVRDVLGNQTVYTYDGQGIALAWVDSPTRTRTRYTYDGHYNVIAVAEYDPDDYNVPNRLKTTTHYVYDNYGNVLETIQTDEADRKITTATYSSSGNYVASVTDESGNTTYYSYAEDTGVLNWVKYPNDTDQTKTQYEYDNMFRVVSVQSDSQYANYTYEDDLIKTITSPTTSYTLNYGSFGLQQNIKVGSSTLATYEYTDYIDRYLEKLYYGSSSSGNADYIVYVYDEDGRVIREDYYENGSSTVDSSTYFEYNDKGQLAVAFNDATNITRHYGYDEHGRIETWYEETEDGSKVCAARYTYDGYGNVSRVVEFVGGKLYRTIYTYDQNNRPFKSYFTNGTEVSYEYNNFGEKTKQTVTYGDAVAQREYTYRIIAGHPKADGSDSLSEVSGQVSQLVVSAGNYSTNYQYTYDANGNIKTVASGGKTTTYTYDAHNQLIREDNQAAGKTWTWTYDAGGNILSKKEYTYTTGTLGTANSTKTYTYGDAQWGDKLTAYNGTAITYDPIGNPLTDGTWTYEWVQGRQLASMTKNSGEEWEYTYDADGLRTGRTNGSLPYEYFYSNGVLKSMSVGSVQLVFDYDANGLPWMLTYREGTESETVYFFVTNLQGDIVAIADTLGNIIVSYTYDAWGRVLTTTGSLASTLGRFNPLRYRGYVYDYETGLYYLRSRYYNPEWGRFINADNQLNTDNPIGLNLFAYCGNNPVNRIDPTGEAWWHWVVGAVVAVAVAAATVATLGALAPAAACTLTMMGTSIGLTYTTASTLASVAVVTTTYVASLYTADTAYSAITGSSLLLEYVFDGNEDAYNAGRLIATIATTWMIDMAAMNPGVCFVAGTPVKAENGSIPIEKIQVGDFVWAWDEKTGDVALKKVVETYRNQSAELIHVFVNGEEIVTTPEHPFYSPVKGWTAACKLRAGDILVLVNGEYVVVEKIQHEILEAPIAVYNFQVEDYHTYYVADSGVLVHNECGKLQTNRQSNPVAKQLGYSKVSGVTSHGQAVYHNPNASRNMQYITADIDSHSGGVWKAAKSVEALGSKSTRTGTYNWDLTIRIGE